VLPIAAFTSNERRPTPRAMPTSDESTLRLPDGAIVLDSLDITTAEQRLIEVALARTNGNRTKAAELLGISIRTLRSRLNTPDAEGKLRLAILAARQILPGYSFFVELCKSFKNKYLQNITTGHDS
jgi:hypothetical protein